jgi:hypothetical protein
MAMLQRPDSDQLVTVAQAAKRYGVTTKVIRDRISRGLLVAYRIDGEIRLRPDLPDELPRLEYGRTA